MVGFWSTFVPGILTGICIAYCFNLRRETRRGPQPKGMVTTVTCKRCRNLSFPSQMEKGVCEYCRKRT